MNQEAPPDVSDVYDPVSRRRVPLVRLAVGQSILGIPRREGPTLPASPDAGATGDAVSLACTWILSGDSGDDTGEVSEIDGTDGIVALVFPSPLAEALSSARCSTVRVTRVDERRYQVDTLPHPRSRS